jgi:predicted DNA binding protein
MEETKNVPRRYTMGQPDTTPTKAPVDPTISAQLVKVYKSTRAKVAEQLAQGGRSGRKLRRATDAVMRRTLKAQIKKNEVAQARRAKDEAARAARDLASLTPEERQALTEALDSGALDALR